MGLGSRSENCCCCMSVKAGTLILLYLDLFAVIIAIVSAFNGTRTTRTSFDENYYRTTSVELGSPFIIGGVVLLVIIIAGLFAVGKIAICEEIQLPFITYHRLGRYPSVDCMNKMNTVDCMVRESPPKKLYFVDCMKKPTLLIPYFIIRIIIAIAVIVILAPFLFLEKKGLDFLDSPKSYNRVFSDVTGDNDNGFGKSLNYASNGLYFLIAVEIILIILQIHYAKVVYACYKKIEEELTGNQGIIYASQFPPCIQPYVPLQQQSINLVPSQEPVYAC